MGMAVEVRTGIAIVIVLLVAIVLLLVERQEERPRALGRMVLGGLLAYALYELWPFVVGLVGLLFVTARRVGWHTTLRFVSVAGGISLAVLAVFVIGRMFWLDGKDNRAIRGGSEEAFERRVKDYVQIFGYSREKAIETTAKIRDGK